MGVGHRPLRTVDRSRFGFPLGAPRCEPGEKRRGSLCGVTWRAQQPTRVDPGSARVRVGPVRAPAGIRRPGRDRDRLPSGQRGHPDGDDLEVEDADRRAEATLVAQRQYRTLPVGGVLVSNGFDLDLVVLWLVLLAALVFGVIAFARKKNSWRAPLDAAVVALRRRSSRSASHSSPSSAPSRSPWSTRACSTAADSGSSRRTTTSGGTGPTRPS